MFHPRVPSSAPCSQDLPRFPNLDNTAQVLPAASRLPAVHTRDWENPAPCDNSRLLEARPEAGFPPQRHGFPSQVRRARPGSQSARCRQVSAPIARLSTTFPAKRMSKCGLRVHIQKPPISWYRCLANLANHPGLDFRRKRRLRAGWSPAMARYVYQPVISCPFSGNVRSPHRAQQRPRVRVADHDPLVRCASPGAHYRGSRRYGNTPQRPIVVPAARLP